jgi:HAD superfamily hydrolase (TIGR01662 family)
VRALVDVIVPTVGRPSLQVLLDALAAAVEAGGPAPGRVVVVDDRRGGGPLPLHVPAVLRPLVEVRRSGGRGPAAARNAGWRRCRAPWVAFLDDDVVVPTTWLADLHADLRRCDEQVGASQGRLEVPLPQDRRPTDWERNVAGLAGARWATADMAYRREALAQVGGFDERFPRAYREDADLGLRVTAAGWGVAEGGRRTVHPVRPADAAVSVRLQAGNADDPFMRALHGGGWRDRAGVPRGRRPLHLATTAAGAVGLGAAALRRRRLAAASLAAWASLTADFAWRRIAPGPRTPAEVARMVWTSAAIPPAATAHWLRGWAALPARLSRPGPQPLDADAGQEAEATGAAPGPSRPVRAVLFDRDGTLIRDVPYNGDPRRVAVMPGAREALDRLRDAGLPVGVVSNQSGVARGLITRAQVDAVNGRVEELLGPLGTWAVCPHGPRDGCACRKPEPGLVLQAATALGVAPEDCVVIGDIAADVGAAAAAGARSIMVPTPVTLEHEVAAAPVVASDLRDAVDLVLAWADGVDVDLPAPRRRRDGDDLRVLGGGSSPLRVAGSVTGITSPPDSEGDPRSGVAAGVVTEAGS